jgi:hypothetical protein
MRLCALVEAGDPEAIDVYLAEEDAQRTLEDRLRDEPDCHNSKMCRVQSPTVPQRDAPLPSKPSLAVAQGAALTACAAIDATRGEGGHDRESLGQRSFPQRVAQS